MKVGAAVVDVSAASEAEPAAGEDDNGSIMEETESLTPTAEAAENHSPESFLPTEASPETVPLEASESEILDRASASEGGFDKMSVDSSKDALEKRAGQKWRRQGIDGGGVMESGGIRVKDYVMEWIGWEVKMEMPKSDAWMAEAEEVAAAEKMARSERKRHSKRLEWWTALDDDRVRRKKDKPRPRQAREWRREEFCEELCRKTRKKNKAAASENSDDQWWQRDDEEKKKKRRSGIHSSMDWWMDGLSGELRWGRRNSLDSLGCDISRSGCVSSTPSMRGTVCYVEPEYGGGGQLSEKCDVYSFGVLLLVVVSGRRPLQMTASPISEFEGRISSLGRGAYRAAGSFLIWSTLRFRV